MKITLAPIITLLLLSPTTHAQVLSPAWLYGQILQKALSTNSPSCSAGKTTGKSNRSIASTQESGLSEREVDGWRLVENKPTIIKNKTLLLPGFLGTDYVYQSMLHDPKMEKEGFQLIAGNAPGFDGLPVPHGFDFSIAAYADLVEKMAAKEKINTLVGHSYMATVLSEVARRGKFKGKIVMISPALESDDEPLSTRALDLITRNREMRDLAWTGMYQFMDEAFSEFFKSNDTEHLHAAAEEAKKTPIPYAQRILLQYFNYLRSDHSFLDDIKQNKTEIHYINGGEDIVQLKEENKTTLTASGKVKFHHFPNASHMVMIDEPKKINELLRTL